ncbi:protein phosphatase 1 regulatory subunit 35 isoform X2 [Polypterus senegalus]|nr:protein phosphatase 1 regulatory subunit 35 isoform X2 [Polypterus senegalus]XP_039603069.1 protein phosphatase 1 regulatory subunit 35 isoform X2 [Polypterus senegalus]
MKLDSATLLPEQGIYTPEKYSNQDSFPTQCAPRPLSNTAEIFGSHSELDISLTPEKMERGLGILKNTKRGAEYCMGGKTNRRQVRFDIDSGFGGHDNELSTAGAQNEQETRIITVVAENRPISHSNPTSIFSKATVMQQKEAPSKTAKKAPKGGQKSKKQSHPPKRLETPVEIQLFTPVNMLHNPVLNTTLALGEELKCVSELGFDSKKAVQEHLKKSSVTRNAVEGRITEALNIPREQHMFRALVSVTVPADQVLNNAEREKMSMVPPYRSESRKPVPTESPDLMTFYNPTELLTETPYIPREGLPPLKTVTRHRPSNTVFDLYRKKKQWEL